MQSVRIAVIAGVGSGGLGFIVYGVHGWYTLDPSYAYALVSTGAILVALAFVAGVLLGAINSAIKQAYGRFNTTNAVSITEETRIVDSEGNMDQTSGTIRF